MRKILFVCTGNTCRSPMAAALFNQMAEGRGLKDVTAESAGLAAREGDGASANAILAAREKGADLSGHRARLLTGAMLEEADEVYVMSPPHQQALCRAMPQLCGKVCVLGGGIPDPYGGDLPEYRRCRDAMMRAIQHIIEQVGA